MNEQNNHPPLLNHRFLTDTFASILENDEKMVLDELAGMILDGTLDMNRPFADLIGISYSRLKYFVYCRRNGLPYPHIPPRNQATLTNTNRYTEA